MATFVIQASNGYVVCDDGAGNPTTCEKVDHYTELFTEFHAAERFRASIISDRGLFDGKTLGVSKIVLVPATEKDI